MLFRQGRLIDQCFRLEILSLTYPHSLVGWLGCKTLPSFPPPETAPAALNASLAIVCQSGRANATMQADVAVQQPALNDSSHSGSSKPDRGAVQLFGMLRDQVHLSLTPVIGSIQ